jgi:hypothetical protein
VLLNGLQDVSIVSFSLSNKLQGKENSGQLHQNFVQTITANPQTHEPAAGSVGTKVLRGWIFK